MANIVYKLKPLYEDIKNAGPGWYKLKWRPILRETFNIYTAKSFGNLFNIQIRGGFNNGKHNGWNWSYDRFEISLCFLEREINFWIKYNFYSHKDGPSDISEQQPLDLSHL